MFIMLVTCTTIIQTAVENNAEPSDNVDVTRACFTPKKESPTNPISVHNIPSQYTADPDMTADDSTADDSTVDGMPQCVPPTMECCDDSSNNGSYIVIVCKTNAKFKYIVLCRFIACLWRMCLPHLTQSCVW